MALGLIGTKVGMTQIYDDTGKIQPVTVLEVGPCPVLQIREPERDGYHAVQVGFRDKPRHKAIRAERGHVASEFSSNRRKARAAAGVAILEKANVEPQRHIREFRLDKASETKVGNVLTAVEVFKGVPAVDVIGTSKGRGFTGQMKRYNFQGLPAAHGAKKVHRSGGSIGSHASNRGFGRPKKGHKAAGQYGNKRSTVRNLTIVKIDADNHLMLVRGAVPGPNGGVIYVQPTTKKDRKLGKQPEEGKKGKKGADKKK
jgi:large subunit ribosomal protein L3